MPKKRGNIEDCMVLNIMVFNLFNGVGDKSFFVFKRRQSNEAYHIIIG